MIRNLLVFSGIALLASVICLGGAAIVAGKDIRANGGNWSWGWKDHSVRWDFNGEQGKLTVTDPSADVSSASGETTSIITRNLNWTGGSRLSIDVPAEVTYVQGAGNTITLTGPQALVEATVIEGDRLMLRKDSGVRKSFSLNWKDGELKVDDNALKVTITAPNINDLSLSGAGNLILQNYDQPSLKVGVSGMGDIEGTGRTDSLTVYISGAGDAELGGLTSRDANVSVSGKGDATLFATGNVNVSVSGMGDVTLKTKPASLTSHISGMGKVDQE